MSSGKYDGFGQAPLAAQGTFGIDHEARVKRKFLCGACVISGILLLIPAFMQVFRFCVSHFSTQRLQYLPEAHTDFVLSIFGLAVDSPMVKLIATVTGALLALVGIGLWVRKAK